MLWDATRRNTATSACKYPARWKENSAVKALTRRTRYACPKPIIATKSTPTRVPSARMWSHPLLKEARRWAEVRFYHSLYSTPTVQKIHPPLCSCSHPASDSLETKIEAIQRRSLRVSRIRKWANNRESSEKLAAHEAHNNQIEITHLLNQLKTN